MATTLTPPNDPSETPLPTRTNPLKKLPRKLWLAIIAIVVSAIAVGVLWKFPTPLQKHLVAEPDYLAVTYFSPTGESNSLRPDIRLRFNMPVTGHHIAEFFAISPGVDGKFLQVNAHEVVFKPNQPFLPGSPVHVRLAEGLTSNSGKKLLNALEYKFLVSRASDAFTINQGEWAGKFMSFAKERKAKINFQVGPDIARPRVRIYKANPTIMLESLSFIPDNPGPNRYGKYVENTIDTSKLTLVQELDRVTNKQEIEFQNDTGLYLFQGLDDYVPIVNTWITLNESGIHFRQDDKNVYLAAQNLGNQTAESDIAVKFYSVENKPEVLATHTLSGIQQYPFSYPSQISLILAQKGADVLVIPVNMPNSQAEIKVVRNLDSDHQLFIYTDRPVYKAGAKVAFRGIVRQDNDALYAAPNISQVRVYLNNYSSNQSSSPYDQVVNVDKNGIFAGEFTLPTQVVAGTNFLNVSRNLTPVATYYDQNQSSTYFDVFEYKKPDFGLDITAANKEYTRGDLISLSLSGKYFNGSPLPGEQVKYSIFARDYFETERAVYNSAFNINSWGGMCGGGFSQWDEFYGNPVGSPQEITLDDSGQANIGWKSTELTGSLSQEVTFVIEKTDKNGNKISAAQNVIVHQGDFNIFFRPGPTQGVSGSALTAIVYAEDAGGQKLANKSLKYKWYTEDYQSGSNTPVQNTLSEGDVTLDAQGQATLSYTPSTDKLGSIFGEVYGSDNRSNKVMGRRLFYVYANTAASDPAFSPFKSNASQTVLKIISEKSSLTPGNLASLQIESPADMQVFVTFERGRVYDPQWIDLKKGMNVFSFPVSAKYAPSITPTFSFFWEGRPYFEGLALNVPALDKLITVEISTDKPSYATNDTALVTVITKDALGNLIATDVGLGIVDKAIYALRKNATPPLHSSFYYFRARTTNSSSSLNWIALFDWGGSGGGGGGGGELFTKDADTLYWNPKLQTGTDGRVTVPVQMGPTQTTWNITAFASTVDDTKLGQSETEVLVKSQ